uniref:CCD69 protein n=1 Tax=Junco hyemalis TaxID=40217 RepID=A0A8C5IDI6_JUNHY
MSRSGGASCPNVPALVALSSCSPTELQGAHEQEKLLLTETHHRSEAALQVPAEKSLGRGACGGLRTICWFCHDAPHGHLSPWCAWGLHQLLQPWCYLGTTAQKATPDTSHSAFSLVLLGENSGTEFPGCAMGSKPVLGGVELPWTQVMALQEHGSPNPFWEQELESLHFVIEMKNEHIHGLDKKLLHLETVEERNLQLEEKVKTLQQENEDLQVRTQNHLVMAR